MKVDKTNALRLLDLNKIEYRIVTYDADLLERGEDIAKELGEEEERVYKTLVTVSKSAEHYVFVIPVCETLDLKKAARITGEKEIEMIKQKELLPLTGYVHGGCSPIGMKKSFKTYFDETVILFDRIYVSAGKRGMQMEVETEKLIEISGAETADLIKG